MFDGFIDETVDLGAVSVRVRHGGTGVPVLLIHGHPRTGATWHRVAPILAEAGFRVVCPDMPGYGASSTRPIRPDHSQQSKRTVAADLAAMMSRLGHDRFAVAGHDRGCYVAHRMALDHPDRILRAAFLDGIPIGAALERCTAKFATAWYHWFLYAQPDLPERIILRDPAAWYAGDPDRMGAQNYAEFRAATSDPETVLAMIEDYRAGLAVDGPLDLEDRAAGRLVRCPSLFMWASRDDMVELYGDPVAVWEEWAPGIQGQPIESGHHIAEENPEALARALTAFLSQDQEPSRPSGRSQR